MNDFIRSELNILEKFGCRYIAGNYARGLVFPGLDLLAEDIDIFTLNYDEFDSLRDSISISIERETQHAITYYDRSLLRPIQLIKPIGLKASLIGVTISEIIQKFDFGICQVAWDLKDKNFPNVATDNAIYDNKNKCLTLCNQSIFTYKRFFKYISKGLDPDHPRTKKTLIKILQNEKYKTDTAIKY